MSSRARNSREVAKSKGLGRLPHIDPRSALYRMRDVLMAEFPEPQIPDKKIWTPGKILDQGSEGSCVGHGWVAWHNAKPKGNMRQQGHEYALKWYHRAQDRWDPWPGSDYEGTSTTAGAKVGREWGLLEAWVNAATIEELYAFLGLKGVVVMGTPWLNSMDDMTDNYYVPVDLSSGIRGGHCWAALGYLENGDTVCQNSWGDEYGDNGFFYIKKDHFRSLFEHNSDAIGALQTAVAPR